MPRVKKQLQPEFEASTPLSLNPEQRRRVEQIWVDRKEAIKRLGRGYSSSTIYKKIRQGELIEKIHYVRVGPKTIKFNVDQIIADWGV